MLKYPIVVKINSLKSQVALAISTCKSVKQKRLCAITLQTLNATIYVH
jgi:hypothetical protein